MKPKEYFFFFLFFIFSWILMWQTFRVSPEGNLLIASKAWSDFAATIPLIRSFSFGANFPPQYPIFAGPAIRYHFIFYALVGFLEKIGIRLDFALNSASIIGFFLLLLTIYFFAKKVFKSESAGIISVILFLFNGSFAFLEFFKKQPLSLQTPLSILNNSAFSSFGPYDGKTVSAFWSLNIFTNQRHLALAYASILMLLFVIYNFQIKNKTFTFRKALLLGLFVGFFPFVHYAVFGMMEILLVLVFLLYPKIRWKIFISGIVSFLVALPQILYMGKSEVSVSVFHPGYLINNLSTLNFISYWFLNLGLISLLGIAGFLLSDKNQKKLFIPFLAFFVIGNLFQFSPEIAANHKFFNLFLIGMDMFTAFALINLWKYNLFSKILTVLIFPFLILSGVIDFFPIVNDSMITIEDIPNNQTAAFIKEHTPKNSVFLNSSYLYNPASLAGRKIYLGWPYFAWSAGYNTDKRGAQIREFYYSHDKGFLCDFLKKEKISYFTTEDTQGNRDFPEIDLNFFRNNFQSVYQKESFSIYSVADNCP